MDAEKIFVGRKAELERFKTVLEERKGQAVLVVGQAGMGKTWLVNKMTEIAKNHEKLKCGFVRYEVTPTDSVDSTMALMMDNAFEAAQVTEGSFSGTTRRLEQWKSLLNVIKIGDLVMSLKRDPAKNTREQFLERLRLISKRMRDKGRAIFVIDPEKYMEEKSDQSWAIVVKKLPEKIKFIFAQRPEDVLVESETFGDLDNVLSIPEERLDILDEGAVDELINKRAEGLKYTVTEILKVLKNYEGHPYALQGSLDLLKAGTKLEELPQDPTGIAAAQWKELSKRGKEAIWLFKSYAILEVGVPNEVVESVSELDKDTLQSLLYDNYLNGLLREEGEGKRIYHAILADYISGQMSEAEKKAYHGRAAGVYRTKLSKAREEQIKPDALAAMRLAGHVLEAEGKEAFVYAFVIECYNPLKNLGLLDAVISFSERSLKMVEKESEEEATMLGNLGLIYQTKGDFAKAEEMHNKSLEIAEKLGLEKIMAGNYGNLGMIYETKGDLDKAWDMHNKSLEINKKLGRLEGMANQYGNLGNVYRVRCYLTEAEKMYRKVLEIEEKLGRPDSIAIAYSNLGLIYEKKGDLDKAWDMHKKSLEINKKLGRLEGMANQYGNLGLIYNMRGELDKAEEMCKKSLEINKKLERLDKMANDYGNLGVIYRDRSDLDKAEEMCKKSLEINEKLGCLEGMANQYGNLGNVYLLRSNLIKAEKMYRKVLEIEEKLERPDSIALAYGNLGLIYEKWGDIGKVREYWGKALDMFKRIGMPHMVEKVEGWIEGVGKKKKFSE